MASRKYEAPADEEAVSPTNGVQLQLLEQDLEHGDPQIYDILQKVSSTFVGMAGGPLLMTHIGKKPPEALHQPHSVGELHIPSRSRCSRKCDAKWVT